MGMLAVHWRQTLFLQEYEPIYRARLTLQNGQSSQEKGGLWNLLNNSGKHINRKTEYADAQKAYRFKEHVSHDFISFYDMYKHYALTTIAKTHT